MKEIRVKKAELLEILKTNRDKHRAIFEEAIQGFRVAAIAALETEIFRIKQNKLERVSLSVPAPSDHTRDYDRIIQMLEMDMDDEVILGEQAFQYYVQDDWDWKRDFLCANSSYSAAATKSWKELFGK